MGENEKSERLFRDIIGRLKSGEKVDPEEYYVKYPGLEEQIRKFFERLDGRTESPRPPSTGFPLPNVLGDFELIREIGRGGMGIVYEAVQLSLNRRVALKVLPAHLSFSADAIQKFRREAEAGGRQSHPGIAAIHAFGEHEGCHYIAQELVEGSCTLSDRLERLRKAGEQPKGYFREAAQQIAEVADALHHAHESGVIHRDVKPNNILLTRAGRPKVTDFGLAKVEDALALSRTGDFAGTPYYMSPEQAMARRMGIDKRTDIYSLGVTLYEMLTLQRPFDGKTSHEVFKKIVYVDPIHPHKVNPKVPRDLSTICLKAMEKLPERRYQSMTEFSEDLRRFLSGEVILARPVGPAAVLWRRIKRNPVVSASVFIAILSLLLVITVLPWFLIQKEIDKRKSIERSKQELEREARKTKASNEFLLNMLSSPDPARRGRDVTVAEILDRAAGEITLFSEDQPEVEASLRDTLGRTYMSLGLYEKARDQFSTALDIARDLYGDESHDALMILNNLAAALMDLGALEASEAMLRGVLEKLRYHPGGGHPDLVLPLNNLAHLLDLRGEFDEAERLYRQAVDRSISVLGEEDRNSLLVMNNLAVLLHHRGALSEAESLHREILRISRKILGDKHPDTVMTMINLSSLLMDREELGEAERLLREVIDDVPRIFGEEHPACLKSMNNLATLLESRGRLQESAALHRKILDVQRRVLGDEHFDTLTSMNNLAFVLEGLDLLEEAGALHRQVLETNRLKRGEDHPDTLTSASNLATVLQRQGEFDEAERLHVSVLETRRRVLGEDHESTLLSMNNLASVHLRKGEIEKAESLYRKAMSGQIRVLGEMNSETLRTMSNLALAVEEMGRLDEAEGLHKKALEKRLMIFGEEHPDTLMSLHNMAGMLRKRGKLGEAEEMMRRIVKVRSSVLGPGHQETIMSIQNLAVLLWEEKKFSDADELFTQVVMQARDMLAEESPVRARLHRNYGEFLLVRKRYEEAEEQLLAGYRGLNATLGNEHIDSRRAMNLLMKLYEDWGKPEKGKKYRDLLQTEEM